MVLANHLCNKLPVYMENDRKTIITIFTLIFEPDIKEKYLESFRNSDIKI